MNIYNSVCVLDSPAVEKRMGNYEHTHTHTHTHTNARARAKPVCVCSTARPPRSTWSGQSYR